MAIPSLKELCIIKHIHEDITKGLDKENKAIAEQLIDSTSRSILQTMHEDLSINIPSDSFQGFCKLYSEHTAFIKEKNTSILFAYKNELFSRFYNHTTELLKKIIKNQKGFENLHDLCKQKDNPKEFNKKLITFLTKEEKRLQALFMLNRPAVRIGMPRTLNDKILLIAAVTSNYWPIIPDLVKIGANLNQMCARTPAKIQPLFSRCLQGSSLLVCAALIQAGANVNEKSITIVGNDLTSPLLIAATRCDPEQLQLLIQRRVNLETSGDQALTIIQDRQKGWPFFHSPSQPSPSFNKAKEKFLRTYGPRAKACEEILRDCLEKMEECKLEKINKRLIFNLLKKPDVL